MCVEVRGPLEELSSLLLLCSLWISCHSWRKDLHLMNNLTHQLQTSVQDNPHGTLPDYPRLISSRPVEKALPWCVSGESLLLVQACGLKARDWWNWNLCSDAPHSPSLESHSPSVLLPSGRPSFMPPPSPWTSPDLLVVFVCGVG